MNTYKDQELKTVFEKMIEYGWSLGDNTFEDFNNAFNLHSDEIQKFYALCADETVDSIVISDFMETLSFVSSFIKATKDVSLERK